LSALFDGELMSDDAERCLQKDGEAVVERWCDYQNVRSALQGSFAAGPSSQDFLQGFRTRLAQEQAVQPQPAVVVQVNRQAANDSVFRWKLVAGLASCATVAVLAWSVVGQRSESPAQAPLAQAAPAQNFAVSTFASPYAKVQGFARMPAEPVASARSDANAAQREVMLRDPALDEFLRAHGARAGGMALENTSGFMRNATYGEDGL
jgi:sigma-E factor negative regulatory protein RseA